MKCTKCGGPTDYDNLICEKCREGIIGRLFGVDDFDNEDWDDDDSGDPNDSRNL